MASIQDYNCKIET